jgi:hypothetical protein
MSSTLFTLKQGALLPEIELTLTPVGYTYELAGATVEFRHRPYGSAAPLETIALTITDAPNKKVKLTPTTELVNALGKFECHVKVTIAGKDLFFPQKGFDFFEITATF